MCGAIHNSIILPHWNLQQQLIQVQNDSQQINSGNQRQESPISTSDTQNGDKFLGAVDLQQEWVTVLQVNNTNAMYL